MSAPAPRPWWSRILPSRPPPLDAHHWDVLGLVLVAEIASQYAASLLVMSLPQIQTSLAIPEAHVGTIGGSVRIGMIATVFVTALADRYGRRRMLLAFTAAECVATALTGLVRTEAELVAVQTVLRVFLGAEFMLGAVVIAEEFAASARGFGIGALSMLGAVGYALGIGLYAALDGLAAGWRYLHLAGALPLLALPALARRLGETQR
ncbi:MAG: MFS transporter, partial [Myxococcales bacterium]|nr:MFS transporter [Myxococcales bacterium]